MNTDILKNRYFLAIIALAVVGAAGFNALQTQPSEPLEDTFDISVPVDSQSMSESTFSVPNVFSFGVDGAVNPEDRVTYSTGLRFSPEGDFCSENPDYSARYAVWLEGEGLSQDYNAWKENGETVYIGCDGSYTDVEMTINAPQTVGEYEYKVMAAKYNILTEYPVFDNKFNFADSTDTLEVKEPVTQPTSRISLSTHSAEIGDSISVSTQSTGDITEETLKVTRDGEDVETINNLNERQQTIVDIDQAGEYNFELQTFYEGDNFYSDTSTATVQVDGYEEADAEIQTDSTAEKGDTVTLDGSRSSGEGGLSYTWDVNSNEIGYEETAQYTISQADTTLAVQLEIEDSEGQRDTATQSITVPAEDDDDDDSGMKEVWIPDEVNSQCEIQEVDSEITLDPSFDSEQSCLDYLDDNDDDSDNDDDDDKNLLERIIEALAFWR